MMEIADFLRDPNAPVLVSYPRTGSHWLRVLMEFAFDRPGLSRAFLPHPNDNVFIFHDHDLDLRVTRKVVIYLYRKQASDVVFSNLAYYNLEPLPQHVRRFSIAYGNNLVRWLLDEQFTRRKLIIRYRGLSDICTIEKISEFLSVPIVRQIDPRSVTKEMVGQLAQIPNAVRIGDEYEEKRMQFRKEHGGEVEQLILSQGRQNLRPYLTF